MYIMTKCVYISPCVVFHETFFLFLTISSLPSSSQSKVDTASPNFITLPYYKPTYNVFSKPLPIVPIEYDTFTNIFLQSYIFIFVTFIFYFTSSLNVFFSSYTFFFWPYCVSKWFLFHTSRHPWIFVFIFLIMMALTCLSNFPLLARNFSFLVSNPPPNVYPMTTRAKHGIFKPKVLTM